MQEKVHPVSSILMVDDELEAIEGGKLILASDGISNVIGCQDSRQVMSLLKQHDIKVILLDLSMPQLSGEELLKLITRDYPFIPVIIVTGRNEVDTAVNCMKAGAFDYVVKPVEQNRMVSIVRHAIELQDESRQNRAFREKVFKNELQYPELFSEIITRDRKMRSIFQYIESISETNRPVLITGETGAGKELIGRAVHALSFCKGQFVAVNIAGLDDNTFNDTLFGHMKGAFTGADKMRSGLIEQAAGGTLFLDEIGDLNPSSQVKLLRLLQEEEYFPLGADVPKGADARIVAATNHDLQELQKQGDFRPDLYYRLQTLHIRVPPLRERLGDLSLLVDSFLEQAAKKLGKKTPKPPDELITLLAAYYFPGNIRELESMVFEAVAQHRSRMLSMDVFKKNISKKPHQPIEKRVAEMESVFSLFEQLPTLKEAPQILMAEALKRANGNQAVAAQLLGITRSGLNKALKRVGK